METSKFLIKRYNEIKEENVDFRNWNLSKLLAKNLIENKLELR